MRLPWQNNVVGLMKQIKSLAIDMVIKPKIWFSKDANQSAHGKLFWAAFELLNKLHHLPL